MKFTTVLLAFVLFVSQAYAELEPVLAAVQANVTNESKVAVNETLLPDVIEALKDNVTVDEYVEEEEEEEEEEVELIEQSANETLKDNVTVEEPVEEEEEEEEEVELIEQSANETLKDNVTVEEPVEEEEEEEEEVELIEQSANETLKDNVTVEEPMEEEEQEEEQEEEEQEEEEELIEESDDDTDELIFEPHYNDTVSDLGTVYENVTVREVTVEDNDDFEVNYDQEEEEADELVNQYDEIVREVESQL